MRAIRGKTRTAALLRSSVWALIAACSLILLPRTATAAITQALLTGGASDTDASSYATASIIPIANNLILVWVTNEKASTPDTPTLTYNGTGLTFIQVATVTWGTIAAPLQRTTLFRAMGASVTAGTITINFGGVTQLGCLWSVHRFANVDTSGTNGSGAVVQSNTGALDSSTSLSITLAALADPSNATAGGFSNAINNASSIVAGSGYTALTGRTHNLPATSLRAEWRAAGSTTVNVTTTSSAIAGIAVEIRHVATLTLANHTLGQVADRFTNTTPVTDVLFRFRLTRIGTVTVDNLRVNFTTGSGVANGDVTSGELYLDVNNDGAVDGGDTLIQNGVTPSGGVLTFTTDFTPSTSGTNYLVRATVANLVPDDTTTFSVATANIDEVETGVVEAGSITSATHTQDSFLTLANHTLGQVTDKFTTTTPVTAVLFRFNLTRIGTVTVTNLRVNFTIAGGVANADVTSGELYVDVNNDGAYDGGDTLIQGSVTPVAGVLTFTTDFTPGTSGTNYLVRATVSNLVAGDTTTFSVTTAEIDETQAGVIESGSITNATHTQDSTLTLANHALGQVGNKFTTSSPVTDVLFRFNLIRAGTVTVDTLRVNFTTAGGVANADVTSGALYLDVNNDGAYDGGDTLIQGGVTPVAGVLTFTTNFSPGTSGTNYLVRATVANLIVGDTTTFSVGTADVDEVETGVVESGSISSATHTQATTLTLANHTLGQVADRFTNTTPVTDVLFRFNLTRIGTVTVDNLRVNFTTGSGVANGDVTSGELYLDVNNDGAYDGGDTLIQSGVTPVAGVLTFTTNFSPGTSATNYLVRATVANLVADDTTTFSVATADIDEVEGGVVESGSISNATHIQDSSGMFVYRRSITIKALMTSSVAACSLPLSPSSFPLLIDTTNWAAADKDTLKTVANLGHVYSSSGYDIIFRASDGVTQLDHEIERYDGATGTLVAWVRIPTLTYNADTIIYMYYSNPAITTPTANPAGVWNGSYKGVWHMNEATNTTRIDSTTNHNDLTDPGAGGGVTLGTGQIAGAGSFATASSQYLYRTDAGTGSSLDITGPITIEAWVQMPSFLGEASIAVKARGSCGTADREPYWLRVTNGGPPPGALGVDSACGVAGTTRNGAGLNTGSWWHLVGVYNGSNLVVYTNGTAGATTAYTLGMYDSDGQFRVGQRQSDYYFNGLIDELRISGGARDACWIGTEYNNQNAPATYVTVNSEEPLSYAYSRTITIPNSMTPASCDTLGSPTNFPILVSISNDANLRTAANGGHVQHALGYDIIFTDSNGAQLDHEIEKYNGSTGTLVAWVRIPTLHTTGDTITMYYGKSGVTAPTQNAPGVWSNGFREVWHLHETGGGTVADSTASAYTGTASAGVNQNPATEKIDGADGFDGSSGVLILNDGTITANSSLTIEAWFYLSAVPVDPQWFGIVTKNRESGTNDWVALYAERDSTYGCSFPCLTFGWGYTGTSNGGNLSGATTLTTGQWYYAAGTFDQAASGARALYLNGSVAASDSGAYYNAGLTSASRVGHDGLDANLNGFVDEVRISSVARNECWVGSAYNSISSPATVGVEAANSPTLVEMVSLDATAYAGRGVLVSWRTGFEVDNLGFHVYREVAGERVRVTPGLVAGSALFVGATPLTAGRSYSWWDPSPVAGASYWVEEWELSGEKRWHGPVVAQPAMGEESEAVAMASSALLAGLGAAEQPSTKVVRSHLAVRVAEVQGPSEGPKTIPGAITPEIEQQWRVVAGRAVKIVVREEGWYRVSQEELAAAGLTPYVDPSRLQLFCDGREVPIVLNWQPNGRFRPGDSIEFYGVGLDTVSTAERVYWLVAGTTLGKRIAVESGVGGWSAGPASFPYQVERADRTLYFPALINGDQDNFFGAVIEATPVDQTVRVTHLDPGGQAELAVRLQGGSQGPHQVGVELNGVRVGTVAWDGMTTGELVVPLGTGMVLEGDNVVTLAAEGGQGDVSVVESIRIRYQHTWEAEGDALACTLDGFQQVTIDGFANEKVRVFDVTSPQAVEQVTGVVTPSGGGYAIEFGVPEAGTRTLLAVGNGAVRRAVSVTANRASAWHAASAGADLVIIGHRSLLAGLEPLRALRTSQGLRVAVVDVEDVYDEFSFGAKSPQAIRDCMAWAGTNWLRKPRYLLLVGSASYDPRGYLGLSGSDLVPVKLVGTTYLETASDDWFVDLNGDGIEDLAVGRLPVATPAEAAALVAKIVAYDRTSAAKKVLLVADANDAGNDFEGLSRRAKAVLPSTVAVAEVLRGSLGDPGTKDAVVAQLNLGQTVANYFGHGSVNLWRGNVLTSADAVALRNARFPLVVSMTCLNGFFHDPQQQSLAEALLDAPGGAVAVWASSGLTVSPSQVLIDEALLRLLFPRYGAAQTLGDATLAAKAATTDMDVRRTWILFGDPSAKLK